MIDLSFRYCCFLQTTNLERQKFTKVAAQNVNVLRNSPSYGSCNYVPWGKQL